MRAERTRGGARHRALVTGQLVLALALASGAGAADVAWVARINGIPTVTRGDSTLPLRAGDAVGVGDRITTDEMAKVKLLLADDSVLAIGPRSQVVIDELTLGPDTRTGRLRVLVGRFKLAVAAWLTGRSDYEVRTPTAVAGVRGTVLWGDTQLDTICSLQGTVEVRTLQGGPVATLAAGHCESQMGTGQVVPLTPSREELDKYLRDVTLD